MKSISCNCIVCASEFDLAESKSKASSLINDTFFKVCESCLNNCDPSDDYKQVRDIINNYVKMAQAKNLFSEVSFILKNIKK